VVHRAGHDEEQIGEAIDISNQDRVDRRVQCYHTPLCAAAYGPCNVQRRAGSYPAGENEMRQRRQIGFESIDELLEALDVGVMKGRLRDAGRNLVTRIGEPGAQRKQIALDLDECVGDVSECGAVRTRAQRGDRKTEARVELVDFAVRVHPGIAFRDAGAAEKGCVTGIAGARVDFHSVADGLFII
jgi:hypothetical protein